MMAYSNKSRSEVAAITSGFGTATVMSVTISDTCSSSLTYLTLIPLSTSLSSSSFTIPSSLLKPPFIADTTA